MLIKEEINPIANDMPSITYELESLIENLSGQEKDIAEKALMEIRLLNKELMKEKEKLKETMGFFGTWIEGLDKIIKTPLYLGDDEQVQVRYSALRNSTLNMINSCRQKIKDIESISKRQ